MFSGSLFLCTYTASSTPPMPVSSSRRYGNSVQHEYAPVDLGHVASSPDHHHPGFDPNRMGFSNPYGHAHQAYAHPQQLAEHSASARLPLFEAALARSRGSHPAPTPTPLYQTPADPNHPDIHPGFTRHHNYQNTRPVSRSPSPGYDRYDRTPVEDYGDDQEWKDQLSSLGIMPLEDDTLNLPPFTGDSKTVHLAPPRYEGVDHTLSPLLEENGDIGASATQHFGPAPSGRVGRRTHNAAGHRRIKHRAVLDDHGFFSVDMPIPTRLAQFLPIKGVEEQKSTRYTAVTTDPDDFPTSGLQLRQNMCDPPRSTELFIVITMYNETADLFCRTLYGVMRNISHLCGRKNSKVWGKDGWQKVRLRGCLC